MQSDAVHIQFKVSPIFRCGLVVEGSSHGWFALLRKDDLPYAA